MGSAMENSTPKHLGLFLDPKLSCDEYIQCILTKTRKTIGLIRKLQPITPRVALLTIYKSFLTPHLDYGDVIYDRAFHESFQNKLESAQYKTALAITGDIKGSSREKLYQELGLESLKSRRWYQKLCLFFKLKKNKHPSYLFDMISKVYQHGLPETITTSLYLMLNMNTSEPFFSIHCY